MKSFRFPATTVFTAIESWDAVVESAYLSRTTFLRDLSQLFPSTDLNWICLDVPIISQNSPFGFLCYAKSLNRTQSTVTLFLVLMKLSKNAGDTNLVILSDINNLPTVVLENSLSLCQFAQTATRGASMLDKFFIDENLCNLYCSPITVPIRQSLDIAVILRPI